MALVRNWRTYVNGGPLGEIRKICKTLDLKGCKKITINFDPFREDVKAVRDFNHLILSYHASKSNPYLIVQSKVVCDRSEPSVSVDLINGEKLVMKCSNLTTFDIFSILNEHVTPLAPKEEVVQVTKKQSKLLKKR